MNLLRDKRDDEHPEDLTTETFSSEKKGRESGRDDAERTSAKRNKSKNTLSSLLVAAAIFIAAILITYFGFYKPKEGAKVAEVNTSGAPIDSTESIGAAEESSSPEHVSQNEQVGSVASTGSAESSLTTASDFMRIVQTALGSGRVTALFLDDGSFSAEIDAVSVDDAKRVYDSIKSSLPAYARLTSSTPNGMSALVTGSFEARVVSQPTGISENEIDQGLRQMAEEAGTTVSSLAIDAAGEQSFIVMRVAGTFDGCKKFVQLLSQKNWNVSISKLILMPGSGIEYTFVLRFYM